jgi:hypothetical protein
MEAPLIVPVFVDRKTAAARIMISVDTFETWVRDGFIPQPHIDRGQIVRWHWPTLEEHLVGRSAAAAVLDDLSHVPKPRPRARRRGAGK